MPEDIKERKKVKSKNLNKSKRAKAKFPALNPTLNTRARRDYIEAEYVNGVFDSEGKKVIRELTKDEKEWLNKYYEETVVTSFKKNGTDFIETDEERRAAYRDNNHRNVCIMNVKSATGLLDSLDEKAYDKLIADRFGHLDHEMALIRQIEEDIED